MIKLPQLRSSQAEFFSFAEAMQIVEALRRRDVWTDVI